MVIPPDIGLGLVTTYEHEYPFFSVSSFQFPFFFFFFFFVASPALGSALLLSRVGNFSLCRHHGLQKLLD